MRFAVRRVFTENLSYKAVSLFIALILWLTIMGRRDFTMTRNLDVDFFAGPNLIVASQSVEHIKVKVVGSRTSLRRFLDAAGSQVITVDLSGYQEGAYDVEIPLSKVDVPFGVKILSLLPQHVQVRLAKKDSSVDGQR